MGEVIHFTTSRPAAVERDAVLGQRQSSCQQRVELGSAGLRGKLSRADRLQMARNLGLLVQTASAARQASPLSLLRTVFDAWDRG